MLWLFDTHFLAHKLGRRRCWAYVACGFILLCLAVGLSALPDSSIPAINHLIAYLGFGALAASAALLAWGAVMCWKDEMLGHYEIAASQYRKNGW